MFANFTYLIENIVNSPTTNTLHSKKTGGGGGATLFCQFF